MEKKVIEKYKATFKCMNCRGKLEFSIPKGIEVTEYLKNKKCKICGCSPTHEPLVKIPPYTK